MAWNGRPPQWSLIFPRAACVGEIKQIKRHVLHPGCLGPCAEYMFQKYDLTNVTMAKLALCTCISIYKPVLYLSILLSDYSHHFLPLLLPRRVNLIPVKEGV